MSMDIRSFFTTLSKKTGTPKQTDSKNKEDQNKPSKKRQKSMNSSIDDVIPETPEVKKPKIQKNKKETKRRRIAVLSDSDSDTPKSPKNDKKRTSKNKNEPLKEKIIVSDSDSDTGKSKHKKIQAMIKEKKKVPDIPKKVINPFDAFGDDPVKQTKVEKPKLSTELNIHDDDEFEKTLLELDEEEIIKNTPLKSTQVKSIDSEKVEAKPNDKTKTPSKESSSVKLYDSPATSTPSSGRKRKLSEADDSINNDLERYEKKKHTAMLYQKYLNRSGPAHLGSKWLPKGKENCLKDATFVITGVLDSLSREDAENLIAEHGGKCMKSLSGKTKFMLVGDDAGPAKLEKAGKLGTKLLSEDELIELICQKSGIKNKNLADDEVHNEIKNEESSKKESTIKKQMSTVDNKNDNRKNSLSTKLSEKLKNKDKIVSDTTKTKKQSESSRKVDDADVIPSVTIKKENVDSDEDEIPSITTKVEPEIRKAKFYGKPSTSSSKPKTEPAKIVSEDQLSWVDKYRPTEMKQIIGQQTDSSNARKLMNWLQNWYKSHDGKTKLVKPSPWAKNDNGAYFKAALLSGPPGVGKTTTANVISKELGFDVVEFNASDTRSKRMLHEEVSQLLKTRSLAGYFQDGSAPTNRHVLLMDEVDGMSGNEDRGGMQELINLIKDSSVPIICMCNDRQHAKVRSLANYCFDLRFGKPRLEQIKGAMMSICYKENIDVSSEALNDVIVGSGMDIRQILNNLSMWSAKGQAVSKDDAKKESSKAAKDVKLGPWEVIRKVFSEEEHKRMSIDEKYGLFFYDYSINPLFVQENYLQVKPNCPNKEVLQRVAYAADSISLGDLVDTKIRSTQSWGLLDTQALYSSVVPGECMAGHMAGQINFPSWLGKNSKTNKFKRMLSELQSHMRTSISGSRTAVNLDYLSHIYNALVTPLVKDGMDGIPKALAVMKEYHLMREDLTNITELVHWPKSKDLFKNVDARVKAAFTRAYNKDVILPYAVMANPVKKRRPAGEDEEMYGEDEEEAEESEKEDDNIENNPMIKVKKPTAKSETKGTAKEKTAKGKTTSKPRAKRGK